MATVMLLPSIRGIPCSRRLSTEFVQRRCDLSLGSHAPGCLLVLVKGKVKSTRTRRCARASLFGVGAPEVLVIAVVSLLVFGPKGLAEVARSLGKTLRQFQPTIQELREVSAEFKQTLQREIGLDEQPRSVSFNGNSIQQEQHQQQQQVQVQQQQPQVQQQETQQQTTAKPYSTEDYVRVTEEQARALVSEEDRKAAEAAAWGGTVPKKPAENDNESTDNGS